jgi:hypothetical protein
MSAPDLDRLSHAAALRTMQARVASFKAQMASETRAREQADSERQLAAERDRWKRLALRYEAELRSLSPSRQTERA